MDDSRTDLCLTQSGLAATLVTTTVMLGGAVTLSGPVFSAGLAGLILVTLCRFLASRHLSRVKISRILPARARAGESFPVKTTIQPGSRFPGVFEILFSDPLSPVTRERRITLTMGQGNILNYTGKSMARGPLRPGKWMIHSTWPLGFFSVKQFGQFHDNQPLILLPKPYLPGELGRHLHSHSQGRGDRSLDPPDPSSDFRLLREFRSGDPVRAIHWPGSLRTNRLQVSELEPPRPRPRSYGILIHSYSPPGQLLTPGTFELMLRIATGLLFRFRSDEIPVVFRHAPKPLVLLKSRTLFDSQLDSLALARQILIHSLSPLLAAPGEFKECDEVFILSDCPKNEWQTPLQSLFGQCCCIDVSSLNRKNAIEFSTRRKIT